MYARKADNIKVLDIFGACMVPYIIKCYKHEQFIQGSTREQFGQIIH